MDCRKTMNLLSPHLDGALSKEEDDALTTHMAECASCAGELALRERLALALQELGREEVQAPPELCGLVMGRLRAKRKAAFAWLPAAWRKSVAAAAAVLLLAGGSAGVTAGLKIAGIGKMIGYEAPTTKITDSGSGVLTPNDSSGSGTSQQGAPGNPGGDMNTPIVPVEGNNPGSTPVTNPDSVNTPGNARSGDIPTNNTSGKTASGGGAGSPAGGSPALLSSGMKVTSTILKVAVDDLSGARAKAVALAAGAGAATQVFPEQADGKKIVVLRLTIPAAQAPGLMAGLNGLGTPVDRQDESRDLTSLYNETMVQYRDLQSRIASAKDAGEQRQLELQAASYRQQLDAWEAEAGKRVIMLWLESS